MKLSCFAWRVLLAIMLSCGMSLFPLATAEESNCPDRTHHACPPTPLENACELPTAADSGIAGGCQFCSEHDPIYDAEVYGLVSDAPADLEVVEKITVVHVAGRQSVTLTAADPGVSTDSPDAVSEAAGVTAESTSLEETEFTFNFEEYEYDYGFDDEPEVAAVAELEANEIDMTEPARDDHLAGDAWNEYGDYDEYGYDEFSVDETVADSEGEQAEEPNHVEVASQVIERNIWGEPINSEVAEPETADQPQTSPDSPSPKALATNDECGWADWDCWYEFEIVQEPAAADTNVDVGNSVRHLKMQTLQILAGSCRHAGRTLQVISDDLMRISGENVAERTSCPQRN